jgi:hypothetical protein
MSQTPEYYEDAPYNNDLNSILIIIHDINSHSEKKYWIF